MKWTKFSSGEYPKTCAAFITDYDEVWIRQECSSKAVEFQSHWKDYEGSKYAWAEIELPEVPKRDLHKCVQNHSHASLCQEDEQGRLLFSITNPHASTSMSCFVEFCPFCGYSIKEKL